MCEKEPVRPDKSEMTVRGKRNAHTHTTERERQRQRHTETKRRNARSSEVALAGAGGVGVAESTVRYESGLGKRALAPGAVVYRSPETERQ